MKDATGIAEMGLGSLTDDALRGIKRPVATGEFKVAKVTLSRNEAKSRYRVRAFVEETSVVPAPGKPPVSLAEYEKANGRQQLNYMFFIFQNTKIKDPNSGEFIYLLLDPAKRQGEELAPIGVVMSTKYGSPDGKAHDAVCYVRPSTDFGARSMPWEVVRDPDSGEPIPMFPLEDGTLTPKMGDPKLNSMLPKVAAFGNRDRDYIELYEKPGFNRNYEVVVTTSGVPSEKPAEKKK
jgi:hypothetical protein